MRFGKPVCAALSALFIFGLSALSPAESGMTVISPAFAEESAEGENRTDVPSLAWFEEKGLTLGESSVAYPALRDGMTEEDTAREINDRILDDGGIRDYVTRISQLISGGKLEVSWEGAVLGPVFSFAVSAEGAVSTPRNTFVWTGGNIDLRDGHEVTWEELFPDPDGARAAAEAYLEEELFPELSAHLLNSELTPAPDLFRMTERGLILLYPMDRLSTLSDRAGDALIPWSALRAQLDPSEEGLPAAMGLTHLLTLAENTAEIAARTEAGEIPGIPAKLGDGLQALTDQRHLLIDPDVYVNGRMFSLEGADFQGVFLLTDYLSESWEESAVDGIRMDQGSFLGLTVGETAREEWLEILGAPDHTLEMDAETAEAYRTVPGTRDYYVYGDNRLQLHAAEDGTLVSVILSE